MAKLKAKPKSDYIDIICTELALSNVGLSRICDARRKLDPEFPCRRSIFEWMLADEALKAKYEFAKRVQVEGLVDDIIEIADDKSQDTIADSDGNEYCNKEFVQRSRVRIDARKWIAAKLLPRIYGDASAAELAQLKEDFANFKKSVQGLMNESK